ncbi:hypothetical protein [Dankookia sp. P2]|uniref:hypothetical protein n=1 Tax=Dankookia sp. P2 TaxID=3423955 RepID=UPI003D67FD0B
MVYGLLDDERFFDAANKTRSLSPFRDMPPEAVIEFIYRLGLGVVKARAASYSPWNTPERLRLT